MSRCSRALAVAAALAACAALAAPYPGVGRTATPDEIKAWDIDVRPDFKGLPAGSGSVAKGQEVWDAKCAACHGTFGESNEVFTPLVGGTTADDIRSGRVKALTAGEQRTTLMKLPTISTLWDYVNRAMPWNAPKTLTTEEVYAVVAYILNLGDIVPADFVLSDKNIAQVQARLPNRNGMTRDHGLWDSRGDPDVRNVACMKDCPVAGKLASALPDHAKDAHGNLKDQNRLVGPVRGVDTEPATDAAPRSTVPPRAAADAVGNVAELAKRNACLSCHGVDRKIVGPALAAVGSRYKGQADAGARLVEKIRHGGSGAWGPIPMPPNPGLPEAEAQALVKWILGGNLERPAGS